MNKSTGRFSKSNVSKVANPFTGKNLSAGAPGSEFGTGTSLGVGELGGISHFIVPNSSAAIGKLARVTISKNTNAWSDVSLSAAVGKFARVAASKNTQAWSGDNLSSGSYGYDLGYGDSYGEAEYGGIKHFENIKDVP